MEEKEYQNQINEEFKQDIKELHKHADIANEEMGAIKVDVGVLKNDVSWIKETLEKVDSRSWWIMGGVLTGIGAQILIALFKD